MPKKKNELPLFRKIREIIKITQVITENFSPAKERSITHNALLAGAYKLGANIAATEGNKKCHVRAENVSLVKIATRDFLKQIDQCKRDNYCPADYLNLLKEEVENFLVKFFEWIDSLDELNEID